MKLYHCSPTSGLQVLEPNVTRYFGKPRQVCLAASLPMALFYGVKHFEYTYGYTREEVLYYEEYYLEALEEIYRGRSAFLYVCTAGEDMSRTAIPNEYVTDRPVPVEEEQVIPDVYAALLEQEEIGALQIIRWPEIGEKRREKIVETEAMVIAEQKLLTQPHSPFAGYIRAKYPAAWALALERREGK